MDGRGNEVVGSKIMTHDAENSVHDASRVLDTYFVVVVADELNLFLSFHGA